MGKKFMLAVSLMLAFCLSTSIAGAVVETFPDVTLAQRWNDGIPTPNWEDVIGTNLFNTYFATFDYITNVLKIFTNWGENTTITISPLTFVTADLFWTSTGMAPGTRPYPCMGPTRVKFSITPLSILHWV